MEQNLQAFSLAQIQENVPPTLDYSDFIGQEPNFEQQMYAVTQHNNTPMFKQLLLPMQQQMEQIQSALLNLHLTNSTTPPS